MRDFRGVADACVSYFTAREQQEGPTREAFRQGAAAARAWQALLELPWPDTERTSALFAQMESHRRYRYWSVHWHYMAEMMNAWRESESLPVPPITQAPEGGLQEAYDQFGFVVVRQLLPSETAAALEEEARRLRAEHGSEVVLTDTSPLFADALQHPRLQEVIEALRSSPGPAAAQPLCVWVALATVTAESSGLALVPGRHRHGSEPIGDSPAVGIPCAPGDAVFFHAQVRHAAPLADTDTAQTAWIITWGAGATEHDPGPDSTTLHHVNHIG